jgi:hypothetical protein
MLDLSKDVTGARRLVLERAKAFADSAWTAEIVELGIRAVGHLAAENLLPVWRRGQAIAARAPTPEDRFHRDVLGAR